MKIVNEYVNTVPFDSIEVNTVFKWSDNYYIKTDWLEGKNCCGNAFALTDMALIEFSSVDEITPCKAELHIIKEIIND